PLMLEQPAFAFDAAAEAGEVTVRTDHPMAGHDDRDRIFAVGGAHRPGLSRTPETFRKLTVTGRCAVGDGAKEIPDAAFELRARRVQWDVERRAHTGEVLAELSLGA